MMEAKKLFRKVCMLVFLLALLPAAALAQVQVTGTVYDSQNEPIIGATIIGSFCESYKIGRAHV